ncbi:unnamed protein product [Lota lota]
MHVEGMTLHHLLQREYHGDIVQPTALFKCPSDQVSHKFKTFKAQFNADNIAPAMSRHACREAAMLTLEMANVRRTFKRVNPLKA